MRITLNIDDDVLAIARARAEREHVSIGRAISQLARAALQPAAQSAAIRNGLPVLPGGIPVTTEFVQQLLDDAL